MLIAEHERAMMPPFLLSFRRHVATPATMITLILRMPITPLISTGYAMPRVILSASAMRQLRRLRRRCCDYLAVFFHGYYDAFAYFAIDYTRAGARAHACAR